ncbi:MAG: replication-associated recombination protein A [Flavobacteriales bacterium Tduv]
MHNIPLAERLRPRNLDDYLGQDHLTGPGGVIRKLLDAECIPSLIFWGTPGTGKTTLAKIIATRLKAPFQQLSAISSGVKEVREVIDKAKRRDLFSVKKPILFIDEIHRFHKGQQESLLEAVEKGWLILIGATTENPSFEVVSALLSRCQVYMLSPLNGDTLERILRNSLKKDALLSKINIQLEQTETLLQFSGGDARKLLNALELIINSFLPEQPVIINDAIVKKQLQENIRPYDKTGEQHYDIISAFIKSIRGSDPNAAVYWLARMIEGGEDVKFIARRMLILASEDIGLADPMALVVANNTFQAVAVIDYPESRIILSHCALYLANSSKSNTAYEAINIAQDIVHRTGDLPVPLSLRNASTRLMKDLHYGKGYRYAHEFEENFIDMEFLPDALSGTKLYEPAVNPREAHIKEILKKRWGQRYPYGRKIS